MLQVNSKRDTIFNENLHGFGTIVGMSKGIFQSGSCGSCESRSDVFHHIRYGQSPRATVPHHSIEIPKPLVTVEDHREAEEKIAIRVRKEGYGDLQSLIRKLASAIKLCLFVIVYLPFYVVFLLPLAIVSKALSLVKRAIIAVVNPVVAFLESISKRISERLSEKLSAINWKRWVPSFHLSLKKIDFRFWKNWQLPTVNFNFKPKFSVPKFDGLRSWRLPSISLSFDWKKWFPTLPKVKLPSVKLPQLQWKWKNPFANIKFPNLRLKLPKFPQAPVWLSLDFFRRKIAIRSLHWNLSDKIGKIVAKFQFPQKFTALAEYFNSLVSKLKLFWDKRVPSLPKFPIVTFQSKVGNVVVSSVKSLTFKVKEKHQAFTAKSTDVVGESLAKTMVTVQHRSEKVKNRLRKWIFLSIIAFELALVLLSESIMHLQEKTELFLR